MGQNFVHTGTKENDARRISSDNAVWGNSTSYHRTCSHHCTPLDSRAVEHYDPAPKPHVLFNHHISVIEPPLISVRMIHDEATVASCAVVAGYNTAFGGYPAFIADVDAGKNSQEPASIINVDSLADMDVLERELAGEHA